MSDQNSLSVGVWGRWMLLTVIGFTLGGFFGTGVGLLAISIVSVLLPSSALPYVAYGGMVAAAVVAGVVIGIFQWLVLQRWFTNCLWWILASAVSWLGIAFTIAFVMSTTWGVPQTLSLWDNRGAIASSVTGLMIAALVMGILQSLALRFTPPQAALWIVMNIVVFLIAAIIIIFAVRNLAGIYSLPVFLVAYSPIYAAVSGVTLIRVQNSITVK
ncbi:hypothetical protein H6G80_02435 [Nostoc sp. FACHB-87]|uniref:hypothetical protein n=1 Tax=Nostocaceae TaxID=1162 RepID=UPI001687F13C|nr:MULTISPECIES: hypothetical protein [Nostocaceae]MBD2452958.1 hypothetical protein [Nostoc sp. FACHB-87]MBD2474860.1 hypothetical protein [Anabaena sp. FACHB-83]